MNVQASTPYTTDSVISADGTVIGYRQLGHGPGLILVHGGMQSSHNFMRLAEALADTFTLYVPDRRGRGLSGPHGDHYGIQRECEDIDAILRKTDAHYVFGLSSGALISMQAALKLPAIQKLALYEPPLAVSGHDSPSAWGQSYEQSLSEGNLGAAMVSAIKGTSDPSLFSSLPRFVLARMMNAAIKAQNAEGDAIPLRNLIPTQHYDLQLVSEMAGNVENFRAMQAKVLLLGGSNSREYLKVAVDALSKVIPDVERVTFPGIGHLAADNTGQPERVAVELKRFFGEIG